MPRPFPATVALAAVLASAALWGCDDAEPTAPGRGEAAVRGTVASAKTADGVSNLVVALLRDGVVVDAAPTDADGNFRFAALPPGRYTARLTGVELSGLSPRHTAFEPVERELTLPDGGAELFFAAVGLIPPRIVGDVRCGEAVVEGARIRIIGGRTDVVVTTNAQGRYGATDLDAGHYAVIPVSAPCTLAPAYGAVELLPGQAGNMDFQG